jgi:hypothetical protein
LLFYSGYLKMEVSRTIFLALPQTLILPNSASQVAGITGINQHPDIN